MAATKLPAIIFYPGDWLRDSVSGCSLAAQGLWLRILIVMHDCTPYGHLAHNGVAMNPLSAAQRCGCTPAEFDTLMVELRQQGVPGVTPEGVIFSRRMVRDHHRREVSRKHGKRGGNPNLRNNGNPWVNPKDNPALKNENEVKDWVWWGDGAEGGAGIELPEPLRTPEFRRAYAEFQTYRRERKEFLTAMAVKKQFTMLAGFGAEGAVASIEQSIRNNWTGLFEVKGSKKHVKPTAVARGEFASDLPVRGRKLSPVGNAQDGKPDAA